MTLSVALLVVYAVSMTGIAVLAPIPIVARFWEDDGYFYLVIARHLVEGHGSTFDASNPTNGYHPLWLFVLGALYWPIWPLSPDHGLRAAMGAAIALVIAAAWQFRRLLRALGAPTWADPPLTLAFLRGVGFANFGLETHLQVFLACTFLLQVWVCGSEKGHSSRRASLMRGLTAALVVLARLDSLALVAAAFGALALVRRRARTPASAWREATGLELAPLVALVGGYFLSNRLVFGHWLTISASLKLGRLMVRPLACDNCPRGAGPRYVLIAGACLVAIVMAWRPRVDRRDSTGLAVTLALVALPTGLLQQLLVVDGGSPWHLVLPLVLSLVIVAIAASALARAAPPSVTSVVRTAAGAATIAAAAYMAAWLSGLLHPSGSTLDEFELRRRAAAFLTGDAVVFQVDASGSMAWFCPCRVINGDGLANSWEYQTYVRERRVGDFLNREGVHLVVAHFDPDASNVPLTGLEWGDGDQPEVFPIAWYRARDAIAKVGRWYLFRYPPQGSPPQ